MSSHAKIKQDLLNQLVTSITHIDNITDNIRYQSLIHTCTRIAQKTHISTDRDNVLGQYNGLIEKFRVNNRDDLAERLSAFMPVVTEASCQSYSITQTLSLLEMLSDNPLLQPLPILSSNPNKSSNEVDKITWQGILDEEPLVGEHWQEIDYNDMMASSDSEDPGNEGLRVYGNISSEDGYRYSEVVVEDPENPPRGIEFYTKEYNPLEIDILKYRPCYWKDNASLSPFAFTSTRASSSAPLTVSKPSMTEFDIVRDVFFMMSGTSSYLFNQIIDKGFCKVKVRNDVSFFGSSHKDSLCLSHLTSGILFGINGSSTGFFYRFAKLGTVLGQLRQFTNQNFLQDKMKNLEYAYFFCLLDALVKQVSNDIICVETSYLNRDVEIISLLRLHIILDRIISPYIPLASLLCELADFVSLSVPSQKTFKVLVLNCLYSRTCLLHASGGLDDYRVLANLFGKLALEYIQEIFEFFYHGRKEGSTFITLLEGVQILSYHDNRPKFTCIESLVPDFLSNSHKTIMLLVDLILLYKYLSKADVDYTTKSISTLENVSKFLNSLVLSNEFSLALSHFSHLNLSASIETFFYDWFLSLYHYHSSELGNYLKRIKAHEGLNNVIGIHFHFRLVPVMNDVMALLFKSAVSKRHEREKNTTRQLIKTPPSTVNVNIVSHTSWRDKAEIHTFLKEIWNNYTDTFCRDGLGSQNLTLPFSIIPYKAQNSFNIKLEFIPSAVKYLLNQTLSVEAPEYVAPLLDLLYCGNNTIKSDNETRLDWVLLYQRTWTYLLLMRYCDTVVPYNSTSEPKAVSTLFFQLKVNSNIVLSFLNLVLLKEQRWVLNGITSIISSNFAIIDSDPRAEQKDKEEFSDLTYLFGLKSSKFGELIVTFVCICELISLNFENQGMISDSHLYALQQIIIELKEFIPEISLIL
ncbi:hypothetical protein NADFUDRAFT_63560 [Nadsonia fulvescens var. elongata DSM 6958]|uniref:Gamma-Tubulin ring complex non-core subunit mod21 N-terminal domain-containing protein n=1 Tax=Nadsonia fulvescens var. elongata DSM 6958 TaxID=857566 RepID=A0A1E3PRM9_9ASCO|nr:hypothetical protein NADFUDRAFT_63560 [Nadsonia fulvescens var. elongata DSM 6958]